MVAQLLTYYEHLHYQKQSLILDLTHDKTIGWFIRIEHRDSKTVIFEEDYTSLNVLCARAYVALDEWAREYPDTENVEANCVPL